MKNFIIPILVFVFGLTSNTSHANRSDAAKFSAATDAVIINDTLLAERKFTVSKSDIKAFFTSNPEIKAYQPTVLSIYAKRKNMPIWYNGNKLTASAQTLNSRANEMTEDGVDYNFPLRNKVNVLFDTTDASAAIASASNELLITALYVYYAKSVYFGIDDAKLKELGWLLPRKTNSYQNLLDSLLVNPDATQHNKKLNLRQYYKLRTFLKTYRDIQKNGSWNTITVDTAVNQYKPGDSSRTIADIRTRLFVIGDLKEDSKSYVYDNVMMEGVMNYKKRNAYQPNYFIDNFQIQRMNLPIQNYIDAIKANMERCRWLDPSLSDVNQAIFINIPAFKLTYLANGKTQLESDILVGKNISETVVFNDEITHIVFSPYWNIPQSIVDNELSIALFKDKDYLEKNDMERVGRLVRQKPGPKNPMGLVKFMFPNKDDIYLHDTPSKNLFNFNYRALSHGCINMEKGKELAQLILKNDPNWNDDKVVAAMNASKESTYNLKTKVPIYIGYFTTWVDDDGQIHFYEDIYNKDKKLVSFIKGE